MSETIFAAFRDAAHAESAAGALLDHGMAAEHISLILSDKAKERTVGYADNPSLGSQPTMVNASGGLGTFDPLGNDLRAMGATPPIPGGNLLPMGETAQVAGLNPAQNDYPQGDDPESLTALTSRPPIKAPDAERPRVEESDPKARPTDYTNLADAKDAPEHMDGSLHYDADRAAKEGVTTTTIQDAAKGAAIGVGFGLGIGTLAAVASLAIPGFGLVIGGGALAVAVAGLAASAGAGAVAGGIVGYLKDQGVPADQIPHYQEAYEKGGAILSIQIQSPDQRTLVEGLAAKYGATNVRSAGYVA